MKNTTCKIEWITIPAPNLDLAVTFYRQVFGFEATKYNERFWTFKATNLRL